MSWQLDEENCNGDYMLMTKTSMKPSSFAGSLSSIGGTATGNSHRSASNMANTAECHVVPTEVDCSGSTTVVLIFDRDVTGRVDACLIDQPGQRGVRAMPQQQQQPTVTKINNRTFTFCAPEHREGPVDLLLTVDGRTLAERHRLTYESPSVRLGRGLSTFYVRQLDVLCRYVIDFHARQMPPTTPYAVGELDGLLATSLADGESDVPVHVYEDLFGIYRMQAPPSLSPTGNSKQHAVEDFTVSLTLLHLAAKFGFKTLSDRLIDLPDSAQAAMSCLDRDGMTPAELARRAGHAALADRFHQLVVNGSDTVLDRLNRKMSGVDIAISSPASPLTPPLQPRSSTASQHVRSNNVPRQPRQLTASDPTAGRSVRQLSTQISHSDGDEDYVFGSNEHMADDVTTDRRRVVKSTSSHDRSGSVGRSPLKPSTAAATADRPPSSYVPQRKASYTAATADDILLDEENKQLAAAVDVLDDVSPPAFRPPPPPPVADPRRSGVKHSSSVDALGPGVDGNQPTTVARRNAGARPVAPRGVSEKATPPPVVPRQSVTGSGMSGAFAAIAAQHPKPVVLRTQPTATSTAGRGLSSDEVARELDKVVPAPRSRPKTNRT